MSWANTDAYFATVAWGAFGEWSPTSLSATDSVRPNLLHAKGAENATEQKSFSRASLSRPHYDRPVPRRELKPLFVGPPRFTLSAAESMTCGRIQAAIGSISGASDFFLGGITAYTLDAKVKQLGVHRAAAEKVNCVSAAVAEQMAQGACKLFGSDLAVATTGYAEPSRDQNVADPFAFWALAHRRRGRFRRVLSGRIECPGASRIDAQTIVAEAVIAELVEYLRALRR
jgi:nicotinamide-nucleotide amidase